LGWLHVSDDDFGQGGAGADEDDDSLKLADALRDTIKRHDEVIDLLKHQLEAREREVQELHVLLQQSQVALPEARDNRPWWRKLWHAM
jgi:hypothetical protein